MFRLKVTGLALKFHLEKSKSHETVVVNPLRKHLDIEFSGWDGNKLPKNLNLQNPLLFFQYPPPKEIMNNSNIKLVWIPMWDHIKNYPESFWRKIPQSLRIIAFSHAVYKKINNYSKNIILLQYFSDPLAMKRASFKKRTLFYWNRTGLIGQHDLSKICDVLRIDTLFFQNQLDPGIIKTLNYSLPPQLGNTTVYTLPKYLPRKFYIKALEQTDIYLAPRHYEGVGLSFIEALARGCFVMGIDAPTLNEYITHKRNGYLFSIPQVNFTSKLKRIVGIRIPEVFGGVRHQYKLRLAWNDLEGCDVKSIAENAYLDSYDGYKKWKQSLKKYSSFVSDW